MRYDWRSRRAKRGRDTPRRSPGRRTIDSAGTRFDGPGREDWDLRFRSNHTLIGLLATPSSLQALFGKILVQIVANVLIVQTPHLPRVGVEQEWNRYER